MKNLKKLLAVIVAICVLATFTVPAFAAETTAAKTDAEIATELGVILGEGGGVTADYLASQPTRLQGAIMFLRLKGLEGAAKAFTGTDNFEDVSVVNDTNKAILAYLKANPDLGFQGVGNNTFAPLKEMTAKEYYKILLVALGYEENTDFTWANVLSFAAGKGLTKLIDNEKFTVNDLCVGTVEALKATVKGGTDTLIAKLVEGNSISSDKAIASGLYSPVAKALEVVSATADNLKTAKFVFNKELDGDTVKLENFVTTNSIIEDVKLLDDKKTVVAILKVAMSEQSKKEDITVKNVKATDGTKVAETKKTVTFEDAARPEVTGAVAKNAKAIVITASEPLNAVNKFYNYFSDIKIDGNSVTATSSFDYVKNTLTLNLASLMTKGAHKLDISGLKDYAGFPISAVSFNIDVPEDTTAPAITSAVVKSNTQIEVTFNEDVDNLNPGSFQVNDVAVTKATQSQTDRAVFTLDFTKPLDIGATVEIRVKYKDQKDVNGNKTAETTFTFKVTDDTTLATVTGAFGTDNKLVLTFSKPITKAGTVKIYNVSDGKQIGGSISLAPSSNVTYNSASTEVTIAAGHGGTGLDNTDAKDVKVVISDVKDASIRMNGMPEATLTLKAIDSKEPAVVEGFTVNANVVADTADDTITFQFTESMDAETLKVLGNYVLTTPAGFRYAGGPLSGDAKASFSSIGADNKSVTLKVDSIATISASAEFTVYAMKDIAGNMMNPGIVANKTTSTGPQISGSVVATEGNKVVVTFDQKIKSFYPGAFLITEDGTKTGTLTAAVLNGSIDGAKVTLTLDRDIGTTTAGALLAVNDATLVKNYFDVAMTGAALTAATDIEDEIKPTVSVSTSGAGIVVKFSEDVKITTATAICAEIGLTKDGKASVVTPGIISYKNNDFGAVAGEDNAVVRQVYITLSANTTYKILLYPRETKDLHGNEFVYFAEKEVTTGN